MTGLTSAQAQEQARLGYSNISVDNTAKTTKEIVLENIFTYFNLIFLVLAVLVIVAGSFKSLTFMVVVIANTLIGIVQQIRAKKVLDELAVLNQPTARAYRDGELKTIPTTSLVKGDVIYLREGSQIPADAVVLEGELAVNEALLTGDCSLAIESTMILHSPETREQIEKLGIPVLVEHSSYESHPLGRMEWVKLYGLILGQYDQAEQIFNDYTAEFHEISVDEIPDDKRKTAVFFYLSPNGYVNIRKPGDYVSRMIELAGGKYAFTAEMLDIDENALSTMNVQLETFYQTAKDADVLIYNTTIEGELETLDDLVAKSDIFADMKAVQEGNVWCSTQDMFQQTMGEADMIKELNLIFTGKTDGADLKFLYPLG